MRAFSIRLAACLLPLPAAALPVCPVSNGEAVAYDIVRGNDVIGKQTVRYAVAGNDMTVTLDMEASVRAVGLRVYHYQHHGEERWQGGQMVSLVTRTDDDGTPRHVNAQRDPATGWHGTTGINPGMAPLYPTSFWNSQTVTQSRLLDRENGEVIGDHVSAAGSESVKLGSRTVSASRFDVSGPVSGSVWYTPDGCWVRALFHTRVDGSLVDVRLR